MKQRFIKDCQQWSGQERVSFFWKLKHFLLFPSFRIIALKRIAEDTKSPLLKGWLRFWLLLLGHKYLITIPIESKIGGGISMPHGGPIVINGYARLGEYVIIHPDVLIGGNEGQGSPSIGSRVFIGNGSKIIGDVKVGNDVFIGPGSVVVKDVPDGCVVVGNPARIINRNGDEYVKRYLHWK